MASSTVFSGRKVYWHLDMWCFKESTFRDTKYIQDETLWLTLVEIEKSKAYPETSLMVYGIGGEFEGTMLAYVKGAAYRKGLTVEVPLCCKKNLLGCARPGVARMSWSDSWAEPVYAVGEIYRNRKGRRSVGDPFVRIHFTPRRVLNPDGSWHRMGPTVVVEGGRGSEVLSSSRVVYTSPYTLFSVCGREKRKQYKSLINRHWSLKAKIPPIGGAIIDQYTVRKNRMVCAYTLSRTHSPRHPSWKRLR